MYIMRLANWSNFQLQTVVENGGQDLDCEGQCLRRTSVVKAWQISISNYFRCFVSANLLKVNSYPAKPLIHSEAKMLGNA